MTKGRVVRRFFCILLWFPLLFMMPVQAQSLKSPLLKYAQQTKSSADLHVDEKALLETLKDDQSRQKLIAQLELLTQVSAEKPVKPGLKDQSVAMFSIQLSHIKGDLAQLWQECIIVGKATLTTVQSFFHPNTWRSQLDLLFRLLLIISVTIGTRALFMRLSARTFDHWLQRSPIDSLSSRIPYVLTLSIAEITGLGLAWFAGYFMLWFNLPHTEVRLGAELFLLSYAMGGAAIIILRRLFDWERPEIRLLNMSDQYAKRLYRQFRHLIMISVFGLLFLSGLLKAHYGPNGVNEAFKDLLGIYILFRLMLIILQNRSTFSKMLAPKKSWSRKGSIQQVVYLLRKSIAKIWHVLALIYLFVVGVAWVWGNTNTIKFQFRATLLTTIFLLLSFLISGYMSMLLQNGVQLNPAQRKKYPLLEKRINYFTSLANIFLHVGLMVLTIISLLWAWEGMNLSEFFAHSLFWQLSVLLLKLASTLIVSGIVWILIMTWIENHLAIGQGPVWQRPETQRKNNTLLYLLKSTLTITIVLIGLMKLLTDLGLNVGPLIAGAGILSLAVGFGAQSLVKDVINGLFNIFENTLEIGAWVEVNGRKGWVEKVTLRTVSVRNPSGVLHVIPFSEITTIDHHTKGYSCYVTDIGLDYAQDYDQAVDVLTQVGEALKNSQTFAKDILAPLEILGVTEFAESLVKVRCRIRTKPGKQFALGREFNRLVKTFFDRNGIRFPLPARTIYSRDS